MSLYDANPPPLPVRPRGVGDGIAGGLQSQCVYGRFGDTNACGHSMTSRLQKILAVPGAAGITFFASGGMSACSAIFMRHGTGVGAVGAVIHFDGSGDPGEMLRIVLVLLCQ